MQTNGTGPHSPVRGTPRKVTTINGGKGRQWSNGEWRTSRAAALPGSRTQVILPEFLALFRQWRMENISRRRVSPGMRPTLLLTTAWLGEWAMENGGRSPPDASRARDPGGMSNWARPMRLLRQWNGQWLPERWRVTSEGGSGPR